MGMSKADELRKELNSLHGDRRKPATARRKEIVSQLGMLETIRKMNAISETGETRNSRSVDVTLILDRLLEIATNPATPIPAALHAASLYLAERKGMTAATAPIQEGEPMPESRSEKRPDGIRIRSLIPTITSSQRREVLDALSAVQRVLGTAKD